MAELHLETSSDPLLTYLAEPDTQDKVPGIVVIHDAWE
jgi:dienelactone hydrolase